MTLRARVVSFVVTAALPIALVAIAQALPAARPRDAGTSSDASADVYWGACGKDGGPDCPLQGWMKEHAAPPSKGNDTEALAAAFDQIAALAPHVTAFPNWASIAKDGAAVARRGRVDAARVACVSCHEQYRARFRQSLREYLVNELADAGEIEASTTK